MIVLGIESSAHTFGVGIVDKGKVLSNEKIMYPINTSGIIPAKARVYRSWEDTRDNKRQQGKIFCNSEERQGNGTGRGRK